MKKLLFIIMVVMIPVMLFASADSMYNAAITLERSGEYSDAYKLYKKILITYPESNITKKIIDSGKLSSLKKKIKGLDSSSFKNNANALYVKGKMAMDKKQWKIAYKSFQTIIEKFPGSSKASIIVDEKLLNKTKKNIMKLLNINLKT